MREDNRVPPRSDSLIQRTVLRDQIRELLTTRILNGDYAPGERLVETRIAAELGTSQGPVREALRELEVIGLVEHEPYRGASVRNQEPRELAEVFPVREALEVVAVRLASRNLANDPSPLHEAVETMRAAARSGDLRACVAGDVAFHTAIVAAAENASLLGAYNSLGIEGHVIALMTRLRLN